MHIRDLSCELERLSLRHPLTPTNIESLVFDGASVIAEFDNPLAGDLECEKSDHARTQEDLKESERVIDDLKNELAELREQLDELSSKGTAETLQEYKERAENAEGLAQRYREECLQAERELVKLRKRKGVEAGYVANWGGVRELIAACIKSGGTLGTAAEKLRQRITGT